MYGIAQQIPRQYYQNPERQDMNFPEYPDPYRPIAPGYPSNGMQPAPVYPIPQYPNYPQTPQWPGMQPTIPPSTGFEEGPPTLTDIGYTPAFLKTQIGRKVKIEFLIGTNMLVDREGVLMRVGINYVIIQETETDDLLLCDLYSIKFAKFYY